MRKLSYSAGYVIFTSPQPTGVDSLFLPFLSSIPPTINYQTEPKGAPRSPRNLVLIPDSSDSDYSHIYGRLKQPVASSTGNTAAAAAAVGHYLRKFPAKPMFMR